MPKIIVSGNEITELVSRITWSGNTNEAARKLELSVACSLLDNNFPVPDIQLGSLVKLIHDNGDELFQGYVFYRERPGKSGEFQLTAYDGLIYLLKSDGCYNFRDHTAEQITQSVCDDFQIPVGELAITGIRQSLPVENECVYNIIKEAYVYAGQINGKKYLTRMQCGKLSVVENGVCISNLILSDQDSISDSQYTESLEDMANTIKVYSDAGKQTDEVKNDGWIKQYGKLQKIYREENGKNARVMAQAMLTGITKTGEITAIGQTDCIDGNAVKIYDQNSGLTGLFFIAADSHSWENGQHMMSLELDFQNTQ